MLTIAHSEVRPATALIAITGKLLLTADSHQVEALVGRLLEQGIRNVVFDLAGLTHIDSTGIGRFIASYRLVMAKQGSLRMAAATKAVRSAFRVTRLDTVFPFFDSVEAALAATER